LRCCLRNCKPAPEEKTPQKLDYDCKSRRNVIMSVIANSVSLERLYFILRSSIMGLIAGAFTFSIISVLKVTNFWQLAFLGLVGFVTSLLASRVLDKSIVQVCNKTIFYLKRHKRAQDFILKRFWHLVVASLQPHSHISRIRHFFLHKW
jgi:hypothetical protein